MNTQAETRMIIFVLIKSGPKPTNTCHCTFTQLWQIHTGLKSKGAFIPGEYTQYPQFFFFRFHIIPHNHQQDITLCTIYL